MRYADFGRSFLTVGAAWTVNSGAAWMLQNVLPYCKSLGISDVLVSCLADNEGSRRTILRNGGVYDGTVREPREGVLLEKYWIHI